MTQAKQYSSALIPFKRVLEDLEQIEDMFFFFPDGVRGLICRSIERYLEFTIHQMPGSVIEYVNETIWSEVNDVFDLYVLGLKDPRLERHLVKGVDLTVLHLALEMIVTHVATILEIYNTALAVSIPKAIFLGTTTDVLVNSTNDLMNFSSAVTSGFVKKRDEFQQLVSDYGITLPDSFNFDDFAKSLRKKP